VDSVGGLDGQLMNNAQIINGAVVLSPTSQYKIFTNGAHVRLPNGALGSTSTISLEMWVDIDRNNKDWTKLLQFGDPLVNCPSIQCYRNKFTGNICCAMCTTSRFLELCSDQLYNGTKRHLLFSINPAGVSSLYIDGILRITALTPIPMAARRPNDILLLGAAPSDPTLWGSIHEFRIWSGVYSPSEAIISYQIGPDDLNYRKTL
jgi:hypothetical protein